MFPSVDPGIANSISLGPPPSLASIVHSVNMQKFLRHKKHPTEAGVGGNKDGGQGGKGKVLDPVETSNIWETGARGVFRELQ